MLFKIIKDYKYGLLIFGILSLFMVSKSNQSLDEDVIISYVIDYKTGFGPRKLIASFFSLCVKNLTLGKIRVLAYAFSTLICLLFAWLCNTYLNRMKEFGVQSYVAALYLISLYLICPASLLFLLQYPNVGRFDILLYGVCLLFCILFYYRNYNRILYYCGTTILLIFGILTHHIFVATYLSFMVALSVYDIWEQQFHKKRFLAYFLIGAICCFTLIAVLFFSSMNIPLEEAIHYNSHFELSRKFVCFGYYAHISDHIQQYFLPKCQRLAAGFSLTILFLSPLFYALWKVWNQLLSSLLDKEKRQLFCGIQLSFLLFVPAFFITVDYLRWFGAFIFLQLLLIAYFSFDKTSSFNNIGIIVYKCLKSHLFFATFLLIYLSAFSYFSSDTYFDIIELIMEKLHIYRVTTLLPPEFRIY